jgi:hypothetical protein
VAAVDAEQTFKTFKVESSEVFQEDFHFGCGTTTEVSDDHLCLADVLLQRSFSSRSQTETVVTETTVVRTTKTRTIHNLNEDEISDGADSRTELNFKDASVKHDPPIDKHFAKKKPELQPTDKYDHDFPKDQTPHRDQQSSLSVHEGSADSSDNAGSTHHNAHVLSTSPPPMAQNSVETKLTKAVPGDSPAVTPGYEEDLPVVVVTQSPQVVHQQRVELAACSYNASSLITAPIERPCSAACPFSQRIPGDKCHKVCIKKEDCAAFNPKRSFAEVASSQCMPACGYDKHIIGCSQCARVGVCLKCLTGFTLVQNGARCQSNMEVTWRSIYLVLLIVILGVVWYLWNLARRARVNETVLEMSYQHRDHCKVWELVADESSQHGHRWQKYPMWGTRVQSRDIGGLGIVLYFRHIGFLIALCPVLIFAAYLTYINSDLKAYEDATAHLKDCQSAFSHSQMFNGGQFEIDIVRFSRYMCYAMSATYLIFLIGIVMFAKSQLNLSNRWDESRSTHEDYAFLCRHLPVDATEPKEIQDYFQTLLNDHNQQSDGNPVHRIVGVSIAYDYKQHAELIDSAVCDLVEDLERTKWDTHPSGHFFTCCSYGSRHGAMVSPAQPEKIRTKESQ